MAVNIQYLFYAFIIICILSIICYYVLRYFQYGNYALGFLIISCVSCVGLIFPSCLEANRIYALRHSMNIEDGPDSIYTSKYHTNHILYKTDQPRFACNECKRGLDQGGYYCEIDNYALCYKCAKNNADQPVF